MGFHFVENEKVFGLFSRAHATLSTDNLTLRSIGTGFLGDGQGGSERGWEADGLCFATYSLLCLWVQNLGGGEQRNSSMTWVLL